ncbi:MAG: DNA-directed RNA polymerase subunit beta, partial [Desulfopila sp.]
MERIRKKFATVQNIIEPPHLISMQKTSYEKFLQMDREPDDREDYGLQEILKNVFPINDFNGMCSLEYVKYKFGEPKYTVEECIQRGMTYDIPLKIVVRLITFDVDEQTGVQTIRDIKEQEVYLGSLPLMSKDGVFIVNGTERVIVSQLQRSPGLFYTHDNGKSHASGKLLYSARIIPVRGSWIDLEFDIKDILHVRIDRRRKFPVTTLLRALGYTPGELLEEYYLTNEIQFKDDQCTIQFDARTALGKRLQYDLVNPQDGEVIGKKGRKISKALCKKIESAKIAFLEIPREEVIGKILLEDIVNPATEEILFLANTEITETVLESLQAAGIEKVRVIFVDGVHYSDAFSKTLAIDKVASSEEALLEIYRRLRPSSPPTLEVAQTFFDNLFFNRDLYDLSEVGRYKINAKLGLDKDISQKALTKEDIVEAVKYLVRLKDNQGGVDDIDHLGNRRVRTVGELIENQYRMGLIRMERAIKERMTLQDVETLMPHDLVNPKPISAAIKEFFGTSQLSQFMDQTNPLSEVTHKRRLSALGPGGLSRERAGFEVRDVHPTHYGRICPVETPEGPNIGLIVSLAAYAKVNPYGFIETPYRKVKDRIVSDDIKYCSALQEQGHIIAPASVQVDENHRIVPDSHIVREDGEVVTAFTDNITYMDVAPNQLISVAASLVPFLENDDANRALMGSNMQRQAVPLLKTAAPLVGTGMERSVARDSGACLLSSGDGVVEESDSNRVVVRYDTPGTDGNETGIAVYRLEKYKKSNQNTCFNQVPLVVPGQRVTAGSVLADGPSCEKGELALGKNTIIAFMPWRGFNFEDSILVNERLLKEDTFTSVHIEVFETMARDTKLGKEEITRDIPNVSEDTLRNLDDSGVVRIGAEVKAGDTLVGKVTPKGETVLSPEEKLLRAIFGEKAQDVKDSSLRMPPGVEGVVIDAKVFSRKGVDKDERSLQIEEVDIERITQDKLDELASLKRGICREIGDIMDGRTAKKDIIGKDGTVLVQLGKKIDGAVAKDVGFHNLSMVEFSEKSKYSDQVDTIYERYKNQSRLISERYDGIVERMKKGDDLPPGVVKMVKVYVATKRKLAVGDKMAGRHGNKGVVSRLLPEEDMPFFADGKTVDIVLNPLGVPSRMNVGQVLETHLGFAARKLGEQLEKLARQQAADAIREKLGKVYAADEYAAIVDGKSDEEIVGWAWEHKDGLHMSTPVFDGAAESKIRSLLVEAGVDEVGQSRLYDGLSGEPFDNKVTVGVMYMLRLHHLVDSK